jgi:hypothetical protein
MATRLASVADETPFRWWRLRWETRGGNRQGVPAIKIGPRGRCIGPRNEEIDAEEMVKAALIYALMALNICSRERPASPA